jgi:hypothetical protein
VPAIRRHVATRGVSVQEGVGALTHLIAHRKS